MRIMGNLDPTPTGLSSGGWALLLLPPDSLGKPGDTLAAEKKGPPEPGYTVWSARQRNLPSDKSKWRHLAWAYRAPDGSIRRLIGAAFEPAELWWSMAISHTKDDKIMIVLSQVPYLRQRVTDMLLDPSSTQFWLGAPSSAAEDFRGQIAGFSLYQASYEDRNRLAKCRVALDFSAPPPEALVLDASGWGNHGRVPEGSWEGALERLPFRYSPLAPNAGKAFAAEFGEGSPIELLETRGLVGLDRTFTAEFWMKGRPPGNSVLMGDMIQETLPGAGNQLAGWSLLLMNETSCRLALEYPGGPQSAARIMSHEILPEDQWHHVALCVTPSQRQIYWDGKPILDNPAEQSDAIRRLWTPSPVNLAIGKRGTSSRHEGLLLRAFRLSSTLRYQQEFKPPPQFGRDEHTQVLLDLSHRGRDKFIPDLSDHQRSGFIVRSGLLQVDKAW